MGNEYPKCVYADGGDEMIWGQAVRTKLVQSSEEEGEALAQGWRLHPIAPEEAPKRGPGRPRKEA